jgi:hypothetical protein
LLLCWLCSFLADAKGWGVAAVVHYGMKNHEAWAAAKGTVEGEQQMV